MLLKFIGSADSLDVLKIDMYVHFVDVNVSFRKIFGRWNAEPLPAEHQEIQDLTVLWRNPRPRNWNPGLFSKTLTWWILVLYRSHTTTCALFANKTSKSIFDTISEIAFFQYCYLATDCTLINLISDACLRSVLRSKKFDVKKLILCVLSFPPISGRHTSEYHCMISAVLYIYISFQENILSDLPVCDKRFHNFIFMKNIYSIQIWPLRHRILLPRIRVHIAPQPNFYKPSVKRNKSSH